MFVADSCVYLGLYRSPKEPRGELLAALQAIRSRLWVPNQVQVEVLDNSMTISSAILRDVHEEADRFGQSINKAVFGVKRTTRHLSVSDSTTRTVAGSSIGTGTCEPTQSSPRSSPRLHMLPST
ncbi:PIN-like domain-containing protein [Actinokineospora enzanensis]|uniref:PIN-like domain-containing protein n=1 Tax=Actinokineospora enzanensis TaxID=155975 RepID=UPI003CCC044E